MQSPWLDQLEQRVRQWQHLNAEEKMKRSGRAAAAAAKKVTSYACRVNA